VKKNIRYFMLFSYFKDHIKYCHALTLEMLLFKCLENETYTRDGRNNSHPLT
jgi:hypothetical protein